MNFSRRFLIFGLALGAVIRLVTLPWPGTRDVEIWKVWSFSAVYDLTGMYGVGGTPPEHRLLRWRGTEMVVDYPPGTLYEMALVGRLYRMVSPLYEDSSTLHAFVKLPGLAAEIAALVVLLVAGRRLFGADIAAWMALAFWLNPVVALDGAILGYLDAQMAVPAVLALVVAYVGPAWLAGVLSAAAVLTKAQAIFLVPVLASVILSRTPASGLNRLIHAGTGAALTGGAALLPFVARGAWANLVQSIGRLARQDMLSAYAANVWWIFTWVLRVVDVRGEWGLKAALTQNVRILAISRAVDLGYPNPRVVGLIVVCAAIGWAVWQCRRAVPLADAAALSGWCAYAYALFSAQVHENHLYLAVPFFVVAAGLDRTYRSVLWSVSGVAACNLFLFYGLGRDLPVIFQRGWTGIDASVLLAIVNVIVFVWATKKVNARLSSGARQDRQGR